MAPKRPTPRANERVQPSRPAPTPAPAPPKPTTEAAEVLQLQRTVGNRSVVQLLDGLGAGDPIAPASGRPARIQAKLTVGPANDAYERQADAMADLVLRQAASAEPAMLTDSDQQARRQPLGVLEMEPEEELPQQGGQTPGPQSGTPKPPDEDKLPVQRKASAAEGGFEVSRDFETRLQARRGQGSPLPAATRARLEPGFGADFRPVRVHADAEAARLSRSVSAQAFTHGTDIYMGAGKYNPGSSSGQRLLAHELTHVVQQAGPAVRRKGTAQLPAADTLRLARQAQRTFALQRAFEPVTTTATTHLRDMAGAGVAYDTQIGRNIPSGEEILVDTAQTVVQARRVLSNVTWARAVDVRPAAWDPALDPTRGGYIRYRKVRAGNALYTESVAMPTREDVRATRAFNENVGQYLDVEESLSRPGNRIIRLVDNTFRSLSPAFVSMALDDRERMQTGRDEAIRTRLDRMLREVAADRGIAPGLLVTADIVTKLMKPLRVGNANREQIGLWTDWSGPVFARIRQGVEQMCDALNHWRGWLDVGGAGGVVLQELELFGSDLHERGIGAARVRFTKPANAHPMFPGTDVRAVIKPDDREAERAMMGAQPGSLINQINQRYGAAAGDMNLLPTIRMQTHAAHGAFIEYVEAAAAETFRGGGAESQAMIEAISLAMVTGLGDLHMENILWRDGRPYMIDADNVMLNRLYTPPADAETQRRTVPQSGFTQYNPASRDMALGLHHDPAASRSLIMQDMLRDARPLVALVRGALAGRRGRVVPLRTNQWASVLRDYPTLPMGVIGDDHEARTKWGVTARAARRLPDPAFGHGVNLDYGPGLLGEAGVSALGRHYPQATSRAQIKADLDRGQIPFYVYDLDSGHVLHNNQDIWHGRTIDDAMNVLLARFPVPAPVVVV